MRVKMKLQLSSTIATKELSADYQLLSAEKVSAGTGIGLINN